MTSCWHDNARPGLTLLLKNGDVLIFCLFLLFWNIHLPYGYLWTFFHLNPTTNKINNYANPHFKSPTASDIDISHSLFLLPPITKMSKYVMMAIHKMIVVSSQPCHSFLPCLVVFWGFHHYMVLIFIKCFFLICIYMCCKRKAEGLLMIKS